MQHPLPRVALISLDAVNPGDVRPETAPCMWALAREGGFAPHGAAGELPSATYVCHATMLTGASPARHGVTSNEVSGGGPAWAGAPAVRIPSLLDACRAAGIRAAAVAGDWNILRVANASPGAVDVRWPADADPGEDVERDPFGYPLNSAVRGPLAAAAADPSIRFLFGHLNETDTAGHLHGPAAPETMERLAEADAIVGETLDALRPWWDETVVFVVSDHGMEAITEPAAIDLAARPELAGLLAGSVDEGGAALALLREGVSADDAGAALLRVPGVAGWRETSPGVLLLEAAPGCRFASGGESGPRVGVHGGPGTLQALAIAGGGHPAAGRIAARMASEPVTMRDWATTIAGLLGLSLPDAEGRDLSRYH